MGKVKDSAAKVEKPKREKKAPKDSYLKDNYVQINDSRNDKGTGIVTNAMHVRGIGTTIQEVAYESGKIVGVSSTFIPGVKVKTKKDWKYLIIDKGPKGKKGSQDEEEEGDEE